MSRFFLLLAVVVGLFGRTSAECANACSGHGKCTSYDMCICNRNWQANDCSERVCQFGLAHVDTPKGDLNMDGVYSNADIRMVENSFNWPYGTSEQFPNMQDSDLHDTEHSAHDYFECSNKGTCDRATGTCQCYDGYEGVACQRAACPNSCSGHGVCKTIKQLAAADNGNIYKLWDQHSTMGCECDAGFSGPDCSLKECKSGVDPLYLDDIATVKYSTWNFATLTTSDADTDFTDSLGGDGKWAIRFFDSFGEDWLTEPLVAGASCNDVMRALYNLPNNVIPWESLRCTKLTKAQKKQAKVSDWTVANGADGGAPDLGQDDGHAMDDTTANPDEAAEAAGSRADYDISYQMNIWEAKITNDQYGEWSDELVGLVVDGSGTPEPKNTDADTIGAVTLSGHIYRIQFFGNPGKLREPEIEVHLDGKRPTLSVDDNSKRVITKVWTNGQQGEDNDYFADHCDGVTITIDSANAKIEPASLSSAEAARLKRCLGDADFDSANNVDIYDWDTGSKYYPHIVKLVRSVTTYTDGGMYVALYHDGTDFKLLNPFSPEDGDDDNIYEVYTTKGTLALTSEYAEAVFGFASKYIFTVRTKAEKELNTAFAVDAFDGDLSCEVARTELEGDGASAYWRLGKNTENGKVGFDGRYPGVWKNSDPNDASGDATVPSYQDNTNHFFINDGSASPTTKYYVEHCLNKSDVFTLLNFDHPEQNPSYINLYTAERLFRNDYTHFAGDSAIPDHGSVKRHAHFMTRVINTDISTNWAANAYQNDPAAGTETFVGFHVYKFFPAKASTYNYVNQCSNRGICDNSNGLCTCFHGYTGDSCSEQSSLAI